MKIAAMSDLHGYRPEIPACDLLIIAGDVCPDRIGPYLARYEPEQQKFWFENKVRPWITASQATRTILTWGNHDWCGEHCLIRSTPNLRILKDAATFLPIGRGATGLSIYATPWSNQFMDWAFMKTPADLARLYAAIPDTVDILISHQPPYGHGDTSVFRGEHLHLGSRELLEAIERVRPRVVICGHIHGGHGASHYEGTRIYNVSVVNEAYQLVHPVTTFELEPARASKLLIK